MIHILMGLYVICVAGLVWTELQDSSRGQMLFKPAAAIGFVLIALAAGALTSFYGHLILLALIACALGDVLLLSRQSPTLFKAGMLTFALGHLIYAYAFTRLAFDPKLFAIALMAMLIISLGVYRYLRAHLDRDMKAPVLVYVGIITAMVVTAIATQNSSVIIPAGLFALSDIWVARDRFVIRNPKHALVISPLYFGAQAMFALSIGFV